MLYFKASEQFKAAEKYKNLAISARENYRYFSQAASLYEAALRELKIEIKEKMSPYKKRYGRILIFLYEYEAMNSHYQYSKLSNNFSEAKILLDNISIIVDNFNFIDLDNLQKKHIESIDYDANDYTNFVANVRYDYLFFALVKAEYIAKKYMEDKKYILSLNNYNICQNKISNILEYIQLNSLFIGKDRVDNATLNACIISINYAQVLIAASQENEIRDDAYYCLSVTNNLAKTLLLCREAYLINQDEIYKRGEFITLHSLSVVLKNGEDHWQFVYDSLKGNNDVVAIMTKVNPQLLQNVTNASTGHYSVKSALIFFVHGFNTRGDWKNIASEIFSNADGKFKYTVLPFDYGDFRVGFVMPRSRAKAIQKFNDFYKQKTSKYSGIENVYCIAHSFGTHIIGENLINYSEVYFDKIIFAGSIIRKDYNWMYAKSKRPNLKVLFEIQKKDFALKAANLYSFLPWVNWIGDAGRSNFDQKYDFIELTNHKNHGHSDVLNEEYIRSKWLDFMKS